MKSHLERLEAEDDRRRPVLIYANDWREDRLRVTRRVMGRAHVRCRPSPS